LLEAAADADPVVAEPAEEPAEGDEPELPEGAAAAEEEVLGG